MTSYSPTVNVPADWAWEVLGHRFDRIGDWATAINSSRPLTNPSPLPDAPPLAGCARRASP